MARCMRMDCCKLRHIFSVFFNQRQHDGEHRTLFQFAIHRYGAVGNPHTIDMRWKVDMRLSVSTSIDVTACETDGDNLLFLGFHGFGNDENEMIRTLMRFMMFRSETYLQRTTPLLLPSIQIICRSEARTNVLTSEATTGIRMDVP